MLLNHMAFDQYHLFRSESRVLSGNEERAAGVAPTRRCQRQLRQKPLLPMKNSLAQPEPATTLRPQRLRQPPYSPPPLPVNPLRSAPRSQHRCPMDQSNTRPSLESAGSRA